MKLARKIAAALAILVLCVVGFFARFSAMRQSELLRNDMRRDHLLLGRALASALGDAYREGGEGRARSILEDAARGEQRIALGWVWLDVPSEGPLPEPTRAALSRGDEWQAEDGGALATFVPVRAGPRPAALSLIEPLAEVERYVRATALRMAGVAVVTALACAAITLVLGLRFVGRPMEQLVAQARRVGAGDFSVRLSLRQRDEIADLAADMNAMCNQLDLARKDLEAETARRIAALEQLRHADRLTTVGKLASGVAHELGTPLNVIHGRAAMIVEDPEAGAEARSNARIVMEQAERVTAIIRQLLDFARRREPRRDLVDLGDIAMRTAAMLATLADKRGVSIAIVPEAEQPVQARADGAQIQQVLTNLIVNGMHAMERGGRVWVRIGVAQPQGGGDEQACITVQDEGVGMPPDVVARCFEPFFTTKGVGEGTGLGLSVSYGIIQDHGGHIEVESEVGKGSTFRVWLPRRLGEDEGASAS
jgi:signal transduction histidine kinase